MKTASIPSLRVAPGVREAVEAMLAEGESLSGFVLEAIELNVQRRRAQQEFLERGLASGARAKKTGEYIPLEAVLSKLDARLEPPARATKRLRRPTPK